MIEALVVLRRAWLWILMAGLAGAGVVSGCTRVLTPERWEAATTILVTPAQPAAIVARLNSRSMREAVGASGEEEISASAGQAPAVVTIRTRAGSGPRAVYLANAARSALETRIEEARLREAQQRRRLLSNAASDLRAVVNDLVSHPEAAALVLEGVLVTAPQLLLVPGQAAVAPEPQVIPIDPALTAQALPRVRWLLAAFAGVGSAVFVYCAVSIILWWHARGAAAYALLEQTLTDGEAAAPSDHRAGRAD